MRKVGACYLPQQLRNSGTGQTMTVPGAHRHPQTLITCFRWPEQGQGCMAAAWELKQTKGFFGL